MSNDDQLSASKGKLNHCEGGGTHSIAWQFCFIHECHFDTFRQLLGGLTISNRDLIGSMNEGGRWFKLTIAFQEAMRMHDLNMATSSEHTQGTNDNHRR